MAQAEALSGGRSVINGAYCIIEMDNGAASICALPDRKVRDSKQSGRSVAKSAASSGEPAVEHAGKTPYELRIAIRDGRVCAILKELTDRDKDPCFPDELVFWSRAPKNFKAQGDTCYYCWKVYVNIYQAKYKTVKGLMNAMNNNPELITEFSSWRSFVCEKIIAAGSRDARIMFADEVEKQRTLNHSKLIIQDLEEPEDFIEPYDAYVLKKGDPLTNGLGHRVIPHPSNPLAKAVIYPGEQVWKVKRRRREQLGIDEVVHDGDDQFYAGQLEMMQNDLGADMLGNRAVGAAVVDAGRAMSTPTRVSHTADAPIQSASSPISSSPSSVAPALGQGLVSEGIGSFFNLAAETVTPSASAASTKTAKGKGKDNTHKKGAGKGKGNSTTVSAGGDSKTKKPTTKQAATVGGRGRPRRCRIALAEEWLSQLEHSLPSSPLWTEAKTQTKTVCQWYKDITGELEGIDPSDFQAGPRIQSMRVLVKRLYVAQKILSAFSTSGEYSSCVNQAIDEMELYLTLDPPADFPFPKFMLSQRHESRCEDAKTCSEYWKQLTPAVLVAQGFGEEDDKVSGAQELLTVSKLGQIGCQYSTLTDFASEIYAFFNPSVFKDILQESPCQQAVQVNMLASFILHYSCPIECVREALDASKESDKKIISDLRTIPCGRMLLAACEKRSITVTDAIVVHVKVKKGYEELRKATGNSPNCDFEQVAAAIHTFSSALEGQPGALVREVFAEKPMDSEAIDGVLKLIIECIDDGDADAVRQQVPLVLAISKLPFPCGMSSGFDFVAQVTEIHTMTLSGKRLLEQVSTDDHIKLADYQNQLKTINGLRRKCGSLIIAAPTIKDFLSKEIDAIEQKPIMSKIAAFLDKDFALPLGAVTEQAQAIGKLLTSEVVFDEQTALDAQPTLPNWQDAIDNLKAKFGAVENPWCGTQLRFIENIMKAFTLLRSLGVRRVSFNDSERKKITVEGVMSVIAIQTAIRVLSDAQYEVPVVDAFKATHNHTCIKSLSFSLHPEVASKNLITSGEKYVKSILQQWIDYAKQSIKDISDACPGNWLPVPLLHGGEAADSMRNLLLKNPAYPKIGGFVTSLSEQIPAFLTLRGVPPNDAAVDLTLVADAKKAVVTGSDTVAYTYGVYMITNKMPSTKDLLVREGLATALLENLRKKVKLPEEWSVYIKALGKGDDPKKALEQMP